MRHGPTCPAHGRRGSSAGNSATLHPTGKAGACRLQCRRRDFRDLRHLHPWHGVAERRNARRRCDRVSVARRRLQRPYGAWFRCPARTRSRLCRGLSRTEPFSSSSAERSRSANAPTTAVLPPKRGEETDMDMTQLTERVRKAVGSDSGIDATIKFIFPMRESSTSTERPRPTRSPTTTRTRKSPSPSARKTSRRSSTTN